MTAAPTSSAAHIELGGEDCTVGFYDGYSLILDGGSSLNYVIEAAAIPLKLMDLSFAAGTLNEDTPGYELADGVEITVKSMKIVPLQGPANAFSFSPDGSVVESSGSTGTLYCLIAKAAMARVTAEIEISADVLDDPVAATVNLGVSVEVSSLSLYTSADMDEASIFADSTVDY